MSLSQVERQRPMGDPLYLGQFPEIGPFRYIIISMFMGSLEELELPISEL